MWRSRWRRGTSRSASEGATAVAELPATGADDSPVAMRVLVEMEFRESFVEVYSLRPDRRLVTTVEVSSPSNKRYKTPGWVRYCRKRQAHLEGRANLVDIDYRQRCRPRLDAAHVQWLQEHLPAAAERPS